MEMEYYAIYLSIWRPPYHYSYLYVGFPLTVKSICDKERPSMQSSEKKKKRKKMRSLLPLLMLCTSCSCWVSQHRCFVALRRSWTPSSLVQTHFVIVTVVYFRSALNSLLKLCRHNMNWFEPYLLILLADCFCF